MSHDYHDNLPGFDPAHVLHDGCGECEARSQSRDRGISSLDSQSFIAALNRAVEWNKRGVNSVSAAEVPLLETPWSVHLQCERLGGSLLSAVTT